MARHLLLNDLQRFLPPLETPSFILPSEFGMLPYITPDQLPDVPILLLAQDFFKSDVPSTTSISTLLCLTNHWRFFECLLRFLLFQ